MPTGDRPVERVSFQQAVGTPFVVHLSAERSVRLTLVEVSEWPARPGWERFSLTFDGPHPAVFGHDTYPVEHEMLGRFGLFLGPIQADAEGQLYQAVFDRPTP